jgi:hypothetical protein
MAHNVKCFRRNLPKKITKINSVSRLRLKHSWTKPGHTYGYLSSLHLRFCMVLDHYPEVLDGYRFLARKFCLVLGLPGPTDRHTFPCNRTSALFLFQPFKELHPCFSIQGPFPFPPGGAKTILPFLQQLHLNISSPKISSNTS